MKRNKLILLLSLLLTSCSIDFSFGKTSSSTSTTPLPFSTSNSSTSYVIPSTPTTSFMSTSANETRTLDLYGINDFHGSVLVNGYEAGIVKMGSFLKEKSDEGNTLVINSGDMWQGSMESNHNYGKLLTEIMNYAQFDCFTLGNHEFDWGQKYIYENRNLKDEVTGYQTPFLASNIYKYDITTKEVKEFANLGEKYVIRQLENGLKVGIIGVIGTNQITSILSTFVDDLTFVDPIKTIKDLSDELRTVHNVDVVIASVHSDEEDVINKGITNISNVSNKRYVDAVFCGHSHKNASSLENGVPFVQGAYNGRSFGKISLEVSPTGEVTSTYGNYLYSSNINTNIDPKIQEMVNEYKAASDKVGNEVLTTTNGTFDSDDKLMNLVTKSMYEAAKKDYAVDYALTNGGRADLDSGEITYSDLYRSLPFDNEIHILDVKGSTLRKVLNYSWVGMYRNNRSAFDNNKVYRIVVIDYLAFHKNASREYNYFNGFSYIGKVSKDNQEFYNYRDITADYLRTMDNLKISDFYSNNNSFNKDLLDQKI